MSAPKVAIISLGYQTYAVPVSRVPMLLELLSDLQRMESKYDSAEGYIYWPQGEKEEDQTITMVSASRIKAADPGAAPKVQPVAAVAVPDTRVVAAPTSAEPISVKSVPPMREFVDEFRHEDFAA